MIHFTFKPLSYKESHVWRESLSEKTLSFIVGNLNVIMILPWLSFGRFGLLYGKSCLRRTSRLLPLLHPTRTTNLTDGLAARLSSGILYVFIGKPRSLRRALVVANETSEQAVVSMLQNFGGGPRNLDGAQFFRGIDCC